MERVLAQVAAESRLPMIGEYDPCFGTGFGLVRLQTKTGQKRMKATEPEGKLLHVALEQLRKTFDLDWDYT